MEFSSLFLDLVGMKMLIIHKSLRVIYFDTDHFYRGFREDLLVMGTVRRDFQCGMSAAWSCENREFQNVGEEKIYSDISSSRGTAFISSHYA